MKLINCRFNCGEIIAIEDYKHYEYDTRNQRVTSVEHTPKRCMELVRMHKGLKPLPAFQTTFDMGFVGDEF